MKLARRVAKLEQIEIQARPTRICVRFLGDTEEDTQPTEEELREGVTIINVRFMSAKDAQDQAS